MRILLVSPTPVFCVHTQETLRSFTCVSVWHKIKLFFIYRVKLDSAGIIDITLVVLQTETSVIVSWVKTELL